MIEILIIDKIIITKIDKKVIINQNGQNNYRQNYNSNNPNETRDNFMRKEDNVDGSNNNQYMMNNIVTKPPTFKTIQK